MVQVEILNYIEKVILLVSYVTEIINVVKENRFSKGKVCTYSNMKKPKGLIVSKDIIASPAEGFSTNLHST